MSICQMHVIYGEETSMILALGHLRLMLSHHV